MSETSKLPKAVNVGVKLNLSGYDVIIKELTYEDLATIQREAATWPEDMPGAQSDAQLVNLILNASGNIDIPHALKLLTAKMRFNGTLKKILVESGWSMSDEDKAKNAPADKAPQTGETEN